MDVIFHQPKSFNDWISLSVTNLIFHGPTQSLTDQLNPEQQPISRLPEPYACRRQSTCYWQYLWCNQRCDAIDPDNASLKNHKIQWKPKKPRPYTSYDIHQSTLSPNFWKVATLVWKLWAFHWFPNSWSSLPPLMRGLYSMSRSAVEFRAPARAIL